MFNLVQSWLVELLLTSDFTIIFSGKNNAWMFWIEQLDSSALNYPQYYPWKYIDYAKDLKQPPQHTHIGVFLSVNYTSISNCTSVHCIWRWRCVTLNKRTNSKKLQMSESVTINFKSSFTHDEQGTRWWKTSN